jgi:hypothetical protein
MRRFRPAAVHAAHQFGFAGQRRFPRANHVRAKEGIGAPGLQRQRLGGIVFGVDRGKGFQPFLEVLGVPRQQNGLLIGAGADDNPQPGDVFRFVNFDRAGDFT